MVCFVFQHQHMNIVELEIPSSSVSLGTLFNCLEDQKQHLGIMDYSLSQTTLDQVSITMHFWFDELLTKIFP